MKIVLANLHITTEKCMTRFKFRSLQTSSWYTCIFYVPAVIMVKAYTCLIIHNIVNSNITLFSQAYPWYHQIKIFFQISIRTINWTWTYRYLLLFCELKEVWGKGNSVTIHHMYGDTQAIVTIQQNYFSGFDTFESPWCALFDFTN